MEVRLEDGEIREILAHCLRKRLAGTPEVSPDECWFECRSGEEDNRGVIGDIYDVYFCWEGPQKGE